MNRTVLVVLLFLLARPAMADMVVLASGGSVGGTVDEVVLREGGEKKTFLAGEFTKIALSKTGADMIELKDERIEKGEVVSVRLKSVAGMLLLERAQLADIQIVPAKMSDLRKEYLLRRSKLEETDAVGLGKLALWCKENGLTAEAADLARASLKADPQSEMAQDAHKVLGHVIRDGEWVDPHEGIRFEETEETQPAEKPAEPDSAAPAGDQKFDPALLKQERDLADEYAKRADLARKADWDKIKTTYQKNWDDATKQYQKLKNDVAASKKHRSDLNDQLNTELRSGYPLNPKTLDEERRRERINDLRNQIENDKKKQSTAEASLNTAAQKLSELASAIKSAQAAASRRAQNRSERLTVAKSKLERLILSGQKMDEGQMKQVLDEALKD